MPHYGKLRSKPLHHSNPSKKLLSRLVLRFSTWSQRDNIMSSKAYRCRLLLVASLQFQLVYNFLISLDRYCSS